MLMFAIPRTHAWQEARQKGNFTVVAAREL